MQQAKEASRGYIGDDTARDLPVCGTAMGGSEGDFRFNGEIIEYIGRPPGLATVKDAFAVYVVGDSMIPAYRPGDIIYVTPGRAPIQGDDVIIELKGSVGGELGGCFLKQFVRKTDGRVSCKQHNPSKDVHFELGQIKAVHRVMRWKEVLGGL
ncbi:MAG: hypothetical protein M3O22_00210 [Pseudomonadota bacterium]|nr:hypothetical protein [Pseudomonadota bacterium]